MVYSISINVKCVLVIGEFKKSTNYSAIESDRVKLGKQMKSPKLYRMVKVSKVKLFRNVEELYSLPHIISSIVQLKVRMDLIIIKQCILN